MGEMRNFPLRKWGTSLVGKQSIMPNHVVANATQLLSTPIGTMSVASVHPLNNRSQSFSSISSLDEISQYCPEPVLSIEELRIHLNSCFSCGVSWTDDHVSLDCSECGGYSLERPCPVCEGNCSAVWKRDLTLSHACSKAHWQGSCAHPSRPQEDDRLCNRLEKLSVTS